MTVFSIIVTYNGAKWVEQCFGSLVDSNIENHRILAIDNNSSDNTVELIRAKFPSVEIIETAENLGFGKGNNIGLKIAYEANADYVFLLNQDAWVLNNDTIMNLTDVHKANTNYGIISPVHLGSNNILDESFQGSVCQSSLDQLLFDSLAISNLRQIYDSKFICAAAWLLPRRCLESNGGFMPAFPHYGEDQNYCKRVLNSGLKIAYAPGISIIHDRYNRRIDKTISYRANREYVRYLQKMADRWCENRNKFLLKLLLLSANILLKNITKPVDFLVNSIAFIKLIRNHRVIYDQIKQSKKQSPNFISK